MPNKVLSAIHENKRNPFTASQARDFSEEQILKEFYPTALFWEMFNSQHEVILGARGSGKTILMRMACYNLLRQYNDPRARTIVNSKKYIGFLIPINIDWTISITPQGNISDYKQYFMFSLNCIALASFIDILNLILEDEFEDYNQRKDKELEITRIIQTYVFSNNSKLLVFSDIKKQLNQLTATTDRWIDGSATTVNPCLFRTILNPLCLIINDIVAILGEKYRTTSWLACFDEADFVSEPYLKCINTFMRSSKKPFVIKMTIMTTKYVTRETLSSGVYIEPDGNDFNFRHIDYQENIEEYTNLTNQIVKYRFESTHQDLNIKRLEDVIDGYEKDDLRERFLFILKERNLPNDKENILRELIQSLSKPRQIQFKTITDPKRIENEYLNKFAPVFYPRKMRTIDQLGNNKTGWFSGPRVIRLITDGNPRKFIQIMKALIDYAINSELTMKAQQTVIENFCRNEFNNVQSFPMYGFILAEIIDNIGKFLEHRIHGPILLDSGCNFRLDEKILKKNNIMNAIKLGIDYNHIIIDKLHNNNINTGTVLRLSYKYAVLFYLPFRSIDSLSPIIRELNITSESDIETIEEYKKIQGGQQILLEFEHENIQ